FCLIDLNLDLLVRGRLLEQLRTRDPGAVILPFLAGHSSHNLSAIRLENALNFADMPETQLENLTPDFCRKMQMLTINAVNHRDDPYASIQQMASHFTSLTTLKFKANYRFTLREMMDALAPLHHLVCLEISVGYITNRPFQHTVPNPQWN